MFHKSVKVVLIDVSRYNEAKELAKNLEKQANKVQAEAEEAGDKALKIFANLTSLPPFDTKALEVILLKGSPLYNPCFDFLDA